jgi:hypothetical protein
MSIPTGVIPASLARLILGQGSMGSRCGILGVYLCKVGWGGSIQNDLQHIEVYVLIVIHTYNIEPFVSEVKRFSKKDSTNFLHNYPAFGCVKHRQRLHAIAHHCTP